MKRTIAGSLFCAGAIVALALLTFGCISPTASYICKTQPRVYCSPSGVCGTEIDTYTQAEPCPATPIK
jgi:hypothetical protein